MTTDPFAAAPVGGDYTTADDLGQNPTRLIVVIPTAMGTGKGAQGDYPYVQCTVLPIEGPPSDKVPAIGMDAASDPIDMRFNGVNVVNSLRQHLQDCRKAGLNEATPVLARLDFRLSAQKNKVWALKTENITAAQRQLAIDVYTRYQEVKAAQGADDPFAAMA